MAETRKRGRPRKQTVAEEVQKQAQKKYQTAPKGPLPEQPRARTPQNAEGERLRSEYADRHNKFVAKSAELAVKNPGRAITQDEVEAGMDEPREAAEYVLLSGSHQERDGSVYTYSRDHETVVTSAAPLDEMFMNKFRKKDGPTSVGRDYRDTFDRPGLTDAPLAERLPHGEFSQFSTDTDPAARQKLADAREAEESGDEDEDGGVEEADEEEEETSAEEESEEEEDTSDEDEEEAPARQRKSRRKSRRR